MPTTAYKGTYVKLTDLNTSEDRFKLKYHHDNVTILYNYFNDFWEELCIDTWFTKIDTLNVNFNKAHLIFTDETKLMQKFKEILAVVKTKLDADGLYIPTTHDESMLGKQKNPKFVACKNNDVGKLSNTQIFLGSKTKDYENTTLTTLEGLKELYFNRITSARMFVKPELFVRKHCPKKKINGINKQDILISFNPFYIEYKYTKSGFKSPLNEGNQLTQTELVNDAVDLSYNITV